MAVVLDTWAVLSYLLAEEPAGPRVRDVLIDRPVMSWINLGEVFYIVIRRHGEPLAAEAVRDLRSTLDVELPTERVVEQAAKIKAAYRMSYADAFAAATAMRYRAELWTGDPELVRADAPWRWRDLRGG